MKYVVTGGAGFIGSHIVRALLREEHEVVVVDDLSSGLSDNVPQHENLTFAQVNITDWKALCRLHGLFRNADGVFHVAAFARIQPSIYAPAYCMSANVEGTQNVLELMRMVGANNIVYSASSSCYGLKNKPPLKEDMQPDCLTPYAASKLMGEIVCKSWGKIYNIRNVSLRYFNVYGPRSPIHLGAYSPVVGLFFKQSINDGALTIVGKGSQSRDFTFIDDVVQANLIAMKDLESTGKSNGLTLNIGSGKSVTITELAKKVRNVLASHCPNVRTKHIAARPGEASDTLADISLAKDTLKWQPQVTLDQGLQALKIHYLDEVFKK